MLNLEKFIKLLLLKLFYATICFMKWFKTLRIWLLEDFFEEGLFRKIELKCLDQGS